MCRWPSVHLSTVFFLLLSSLFYNKNTLTFCWWWYKFLSSNLEYQNVYYHVRHGGILFNLASLNVPLRVVFIPIDSIDCPVVLVLIFLLIVVSDYRMFLCTRGPIHGTVPNSGFFGLGPKALLVEPVVDGLRLYYGSCHLLGVVRCCCRLVGAGFGGGRWLVARCEAGAGRRVVMPSGPLLPGFGHAGLPWCDARLPW